MRKLIVCIMTMFGVLGSSYAQDLALRDEEGRAGKSTEAGSVALRSHTAPESHYTVYGEIPVAETAFEEEHFLGDTVSPKWNTFLANYTHEYSVSVGFTDSGVELVKPSVYNAVERANRYVKKAVKKGVLSREEAIRIMSHVLDCANVICFETDTEGIENAAKAAKTGEEAIALFNKIELKRM